MLYGHVSAIRLCLCIVVSRIKFSIMPPKRSRAEAAAKPEPISDDDSSSSDENDYMQARVDTFYELPAQDVLSQIVGIASRLTAAIIAIRPSYGYGANVYNCQRDRSVAVDRATNIRVMQQAIDCVLPAAADLQALGWVLAAQLELHGVYPRNASWLTQLPPAPLLHPVSTRSSRARPHKK